MGSEKLPTNWTLAVPCAIDNPQRVLANTVVTYQASTTPTSCVEECASQGFTFAGVEFSDECYCGTGYVDGQLPPETNVEECNMPCAGDVNATCGGSWRIQLYRLSS
ncbi:WSC domain-containing protein [Irpex lacteus]|nr:WSC domain-containing protein [Irpex lacteus]